LWRRLAEVETMGAKSDFWLAIHNVCLCYEQEGNTHRTRAASVADAWAAMPRSARVAIAQELRSLLLELPDVDAELLLREMAIITHDGSRRSLG
jgi:hypothetical protein